MSYPQGRLTEALVVFKKDDKQRAEREQELKAKHTYRDEFSLRGSSSSRKSTNLYDSISYTNTHSSTDEDYNPRGTSVKNRRTACRDAKSAGIRITGRHKDQVDDETGDLANVEKGRRAAPRTCQILVGPSSGFVSLSLSTRKGKILLACLGAEHDTTLKTRKYIAWSLDGSADSPEHQDGCVLTSSLRSGKVRHAIVNGKRKASSDTDELNLSPPETVNTPNAHVVPGTEGASANTTEMHGVEHFDTLGNGNFTSSHVPKRRRLWNAEDMDVSVGQNSTSRSGTMQNPIDLDTDQDVEMVDSVNKPFTSGDSDAETDVEIEAKRQRNLLALLEESDPEEGRAVVRQGPARKAVYVSARARPVVPVEAQSAVFCHVDDDSSSSGPHDDDVPVKQMAKISVSEEENKTAESSEFMEVPLKLEREDQGTVRTIHTCLSHPVNVRKENGPCDFCNFRFGTLGHCVQKQVDVLVYRAAPFQYHEISPGHALDHPPTEVCVSCALSYVMMECCEGHDSEFIQGAGADVDWIEEYTKVFLKKAPQLAAEKAAAEAAGQAWEDIPKWYGCSVCYNPARFRCVTPQKKTKTLQDCHLPGVPEAERRAQIHAELIAKGITDPRVLEEKTNAPLAPVLIGCGFRMCYACNFVIQDRCCGKIDRKKLQTSVSGQNLRFRADFDELCGRDGPIWHAYCQ